MMTAWRQRGSVLPCDLTPSRGYHHCTSPTPLCMYLTMNVLQGRRHAKAPLRNKLAGSMCCYLRSAKHQHSIAPNANVQSCWRYRGTLASISTTDGLVLSLNSRRGRFLTLAVDQRTERCDHHLCSLLTPHCWRRCASSMLVSARLCNVVVEPSRQELPGGAAAAACERRILSAGLQPSRPHVGCCV